MRNRISYLWVYTDPESTHHDLRDRLGLSSTDPFTGKINSAVPDPTLTDDEAKAKSEFVERLTDNGRHRGLIVIAPHGGDIERHTDEQAERVGKRLSSKCVSVWVCKGFKNDGGAFDRWHITSTDISEDSFPKLKTVIGPQLRIRRRLPWMESRFHLYRRIGAARSEAADQDGRRERDHRVPGSTWPRMTRDVSGGFNGTEPDQHREPPWHQRRSNRAIEEGPQGATALQIADAVADVIGPRSSDGTGV